MSDDEEKKKLTCRRAGHKAYATKLMNDAKLLCESSPSVPQRAKLNTYLKTLSDRKDTIARLDEEILGVIDPSEFEDEIVASGDYQMSIEEVIFTITEVLDSLNVSDEPRVEPKLPPLEELDSANETVKDNSTKLCETAETAAETLFRRNTHVPRVLGEFRIGCR